MRFVSLIMTMLLAYGTGAALAQDGRPDARLELSSLSVGLLFGYHKGQGVLEFQGQQYPFSVSGFQAATLGVTQISALGQVYRLLDVADFPGTYAAVEGSFTIIQGGGNAMLRNEKGVTLYLQNLRQGLDLTLSGGRFTITLDEPENTPSPAATESAAVN